MKVRQKGKKTLRSRLRNQELTIGSWITIGHTVISEIMAKFGFDWLAIDMEHSAITLSKAQNLIQIIELSGIAPLVRLGENNPALIKRVMDAGSHGVIVPMVNTPQQAKDAVNAVKYPPSGTRGVGLARAQGYGLEFEKYRKWVNKESVVIVQIEHIEAVDNLEDILSTEGVDGFMVGPYDLSASIGKPGDFHNPKVIEAQAEIMKVAKRHKVVSGFHVIPPDSREVNKKISEGYQFIGFSLDTLFLGTQCKTEFSKIKKRTK